MHASQQSSTPAPTPASSEPAGSTPAPTPTSSAPTPTPVTPTSPNTPAPTNRLVASLPRVLYMIAGIMVLSAGIALSRTCLLGMSPFSTISGFLSYVGERFDIALLSMGWSVFWFNFACFVAEVLLLRRKFPLVQLLQVPLLMLSTFPIDWCMAALSGINTDPYPVKFALLIAGIVVVALGVHMEVKANILMLPGEAIIAVVSHVTRKPFHKTKIVMDISVMVVGAALSLLVLGGLYGVGEGSIIAAVATGLCVKFWNVALAPLEHRLGIDGEALITPVVPTQV